MPALMQRARIHLPELSVGAGWIAALALTAWLAAGWFWRLSAPEPVALVTQQITDPQAAARSVAQRHLFGDSATASAAAPARAYTLVGAMTGSSRQPGFAVLGETGKPPQSVFEGEEIAPGVKLVKVLADKVMIVRDGRSETIELVAGAPSAAPLPAAATGAANATAARPADPAVPPRAMPPHPTLPSPQNP